MQTHRDDDALRAQAERLRELVPAAEHDPDGWLDSLQARAERMTEAGESRITGGKPGEEPLSEYKRAGVTVRQLPEDEHGILRLSIGGHPSAPFDTSYLVFRGDRGQCQSLLRRALKALEYADANGR